MAPAHAWEWNPVNAGGLPARCVISDPDALNERFDEILQASGQVDDRWSVRIRRSLFWLTRAMAPGTGTAQPGESGEVRLLLLWIALNALYGRWNIAQKRPDQDGPALTDFLERITATPACRCILDALGQNLSAVRRLVSYPFLQVEFWANPFDPAIGERSDRIYSACELPLDRFKGLILLREGLGRVYIMRSHLAHGGSTSDSQCRLAAIQDCLQLLQRMTPALLYTAIEEGVHMQWPALCHPPVDLSDRQQLFRIA